MSDSNIAVATETINSMRARYRAGLVGSTPTVEIRKVTAFGFEMDLRQPALGDVLSQNGTIKSTTKEQVASYIINFAHLPGTDIRIFETGDEEQILKWPFGPEYLKIQEAMNELTGIDIETAEEELETNPLA